MKNCSKCKTAKMVTEFSCNRKNKDGLQGWCKNCINAARRQPAELLAEKKKASLASRPFSKKTPINCAHCGAFFYRKGRGGREKHCSEKCRFWSKVAISDECFNWIGGVYTQTGYGQFAVSPTKSDVSHRVSWRLSYGEIPIGMFVLHKCDNRLCVKPDHLFLGTQADNMRDKAEKGRATGSFGWRTSPEQKAARSEMMKRVWAERRAA